MRPIWGWQDPDAPHVGPMLSGQFLGNTAYICYECGMIATQFIAFRWNAMTHKTISETRWHLCGVTRSYHGLVLFGVFQPSLFVLKVEEGGKTWRDNIRQRKAKQCGTEMNLNNNVFPVFWGFFLISYHKSCRQYHQLYPLQQPEWKCNQALVWFHFFFRLWNFSNFVWRINVCQLRYENVYHYCPPSTYNTSRYAFYNGKWFELFIACYRLWNP